MTLYEELRQGLLSGIEAYDNGNELKTTVVSVQEGDSQDAEEQVAILAENVVLHS